jgi:hypothetical protein
MWNEIDILLTANPDLLLNHPKDKIVIKFETDYNKSINNHNFINSLKDLELVLNNIL